MGKNMKEKKVRLSLSTKDDELLTYLVFFIVSNYDLEIDRIDYCEAIQREFNFSSAYCYAIEGEYWDGMLGDRCWTCCPHGRFPGFILRKLLKKLDDDSRGDLDMMLDRFNRSSDPVDEINMETYYNIVGRRPIGESLGVVGGGDVHIEPHGVGYILVRYGFDIGGEPELSYMIRLPKSSGERASSCYGKYLDTSLIFENGELARSSFVEGD